MLCYSLDQTGFGGSESPVADSVANPLPAIAPDDRLDAGKARPCDQPVGHKTADGFRVFGSRAVRKYAAHSDYYFLLPGRSFGLVVGISSPFDSEIL